MNQITRIDMNGTSIELKNGEIYINGKHIDSNRPRRLDYALSIFFGMMLGMSLFAIFLSILEHFGKWIVN